MIANAIETHPESPMRRAWPQFVFLAIFFFSSLLLPAAANAQQGNTPSSQSSPQSDKQPAARPSQPAKSPASPGGAENSNYDPFHAQQDVEVGTFYMHKGDVDAAIPRFEDAIRLRANFAQPRLLLAECYMKKHDPQKALQYYREYLKVYPDAPDRKKIEKKIEKLTSR